MGIMMNRMLVVSGILLFLSALTLSTCGKDKSGAVQREIKRIISLSPSITRQILDLDASDLLVGVTTFHPPLPRKIEIVGTMLNPGIEKIVLLNPDLVILSEEDGATQKIDSLKMTGIPLVTFGRNRDFISLCANYERLGRLLGRVQLAAEKIKAYELELNRVRRPQSGIGVVFLVSHIPLITVSGESFIGHIIDDAGGVNVFADLRSPYPVISLESLVRRNPRVILVMTQDGDIYLKQRMKGLAGKGVAEPEIYSISTDHIPYYTPADYVASVSIVAELIEKKQ